MNINQNQFNNNYKPAFGAKVFTTIDAKATMCNLGAGFNTKFDEFAGHIENINCDGHSVSVVLDVVKNKFLGIKTGMKFKIKTLLKDSPTVIDTTSLKIPRAFFKKDKPTQYCSISQSLAYDLYSKIQISAYNLALKPEYIMNEKVIPKIKSNKKILVKKESQIDKKA